MSDEPLYCPNCGVEDWQCDCTDEQKRATGPFCEVCGCLYEGCGGGPPGPPCWEIARLAGREPRYER